MKIQKIIFTLIILFLISCNGKTENISDDNIPKNIDEKKFDTLKTDKIIKSKISSFEKIILNIEIKKIPLVDSTNFDNFNKNNFFDKQDIKTLQLEKFYPDFNKEGYNYKTTSSYKIELSERFYSIILTTYKGELEMESALINYDLNGELIDYEIISYDEIAEGWSRTESKIEKNNLTVTNILWIDEKQETTEKFKIRNNGEIEPVANTVYKQ